MRKFYHKLTLQFLQSSLIQTSAEFTLSPPRQVDAPIPQISSTQAAAMFQRESISSNFQEIVLSQLTLLINFT